MVVSNCRLRLEGQTWKMQLKIPFVILNYIKQNIKNAVLPGKSWLNPLHRTHYTVEVVLAQNCGPQGSSRTLS